MKEEDESISDSGGRLDCLSGKKNCSAYKRRSEVIARRKDRNVSERKCQQTKAADWHSEQNLEADGTSCTAARTCSDHFSPDSGSGQQRTETILPVGSLMLLLPLNADMSQIHMFRVACTATSMCVQGVSKALNGGADSFIT